MLKPYWELQYTSAIDMKVFFRAAIEQKAELKGTLKQSKDGFTYVNISNNIMNGFFMLIEDPLAVQPPYRRDSFNKIGAHISVIKSHETEMHNLFKIPEIGKDYPFTVKDMVTLDPEGWDEVSKVWILQVESQELENLRRKYGLTPLIDGHEFHITVAIRRKR